MFLELAPVSEMEKKKAVEGPFDSPNWLFWLLLSNSRIVSPFWEKEIPACYFSKISWVNK